MKNRGLRLWKASVLFRVAAILIGLFAAGHTFGFRQIDPRWQIDTLIASMQQTRFAAQGWPRTYWDFYVGFGLFVSVFLVLAAGTCWLLGSVPMEVLWHVRGLGWLLTGAFALVTVLSWRYFFTVPLIFSAVITVCLLAATLLCRMPASQASGPG